MLTTAELTAMRDTLEDSLPDTCVILTVTLASDSAGGHTESTSSTTVACRVSPSSGGAGGNEDTYGGRVTPLNRWTITVPHGSTVTGKSRITFGSRTFEVLSIGSVRSWDLCIRVECLEVL